MSKVPIVDGPTWIRAQIIEDKRTLGYGKRANQEVTVEEDVHLTFPRYERISVTNTATGRLAAPRTVQNGEDTIFLSRGMKLTIWDVKRKNRNQRGVTDATFYYPTHVVNYKPMENLERRYNP